MTIEELKQARTELGDNLMDQMDQMKKMIARYAKKVGYDGEYLITLTMGSHDFYAIADAFPKSEDRRPFEYLFKEERTHDGERFSPENLYIGEVDEDD